jgi:hypothetical protein
MKLLLRNFSVIVFFALLPFSGSSQLLYDESVSGDLTNAPFGSVFNATGAGTFTFAGTLSTPTDGQDWFQINVPAGFLLNSVDYSMSGGGIVGSANFSFYGSGTAPGSGQISIAPFSYPLPAGAYSTQMSANFSTGTPWIMSFTIIVDPLPIKLESFTVTNQSGSNRLEWNTASEDKGDYFELEHSLTGDGFSSIANITAKGCASHYSYTDAAPQAGSNYYRLKMVSPSGEINYSRIVSTTVQEMEDMQVFPNPVSDMLQIRLSASVENPGTLRVFDLSGRLMITTTADQSTQSIDMSPLQSGIYLLQYRNNRGATQTERVVRQ